MRESAASGAATGTSERELIDELAVVFSDEHEAKLVLDRARFPRKLLPTFRTPLSFWSAVMNAAHSGALHGEQRPIVDAAAELRPANRVFARHRDRGVHASSDSSLPRRLKLVLELKTWLRVTATVTLGIAIVYIGGDEEDMSSDTVTVASVVDPTTSTPDRFDDSGVPSLAKPTTAPETLPYERDTPSHPFESDDGGGPDVAPEPHASVAKPRRPKPRPASSPRSDGAIVSELRAKISQKCKNDGSTIVRIEGIISSSGLAVALLATPRSGAGECVKRIVAGTRFDPAPGTRPMPRFSVEL